MGGLDPGVNWGVKEGVNWGVKWPLLDRIADVVFCTSDVNKWCFWPHTLPECPERTTTNDAIDYHAEISPTTYSVYSYIYTVEHP